MVGQGQTGKSSALCHLFVQHIEQGGGAVLIDLRGGLADRALESIPRNRTNEVIYFNPSDSARPIGINLVETLPLALRSQAGENLLNAFKGIWAGQWGILLERILRAAIRSQLDCPSSTILGVARMLTDKPYREQAAKASTDPAIGSFWADFETWDKRDQQQSVRPVLTRLDQITTNPTLRNIFGQVSSSFSFREVLEDRMILVANLSGKKIGPDAASLLGALLLAKLHIAAQEDESDPGEPTDEHLIVLDDMHNLRLGALPQMLLDARYCNPRLAFAMAVPTLSEHIREGALEKVGSLVGFRSGLSDADLLADIIADPRFHSDDFPSLHQGEFIARLWDAGMPYPIRGSGLQPLQQSEQGTKRRETIINRSRRLYGGRRSVMERKVRSFYGGSAEHNSAFTP
jgi:hypothetical protein